MATPEEIASQPEPLPDLRLIQGGLAVNETVDIIPIVHRPFNEMALSLKEEDWADMSAEQLIDIREQISKYTGELALLIHKLQQDHDAAIQKKVWINGFIRDRQ